MRGEKDPVQLFEQEKKERIAGYGRDPEFNALSRKWFQESMRRRYPYNFNWLGRPVIQYPTDVFALQEIIYSVQPELIIETGIAHGGSIIFSASMLELVSLCGGREGEVLGIDVEIRPHNKKAIQAHPMSRRISMIEGSSILQEVATQSLQHAKDKSPVLVILDSNHTHEHVLAELEIYAPLVSPGSYCVVFDTHVEDSEEDLFPQRPWCRGNNPKTAVYEYLRCLREEGRTAQDGGVLRMEVDEVLESKLQITSAPEGFLRRLPE
ncbi:Cephalosporin hydroxylase [Desulfonatronospira thiodismutans ASO3-1]|uniref:Cephalosporin hydroxylase n=1 Tax=Desulfonatronospira thiodismutans ASO3-1 TaxID=555779 RepID=D6SN87_9BACT|nr:cephalosporin hydroxylase family protein [Desulfonatronospira thiodismutans]EFI34213.1 Cephalosporin hydroxylase [Desulfonatronospira thiodismutans ASO3-1]